MGGAAEAGGGRDPAGQLDRDEDPVDAVVCAYVALYWYHRPDDVTIYGDFETGYIVTPTLPRDLVPERRRRPVHPTLTDITERLAATRSATRERRSSS